MSERLSVLFQEKLICAFELVDADGYYREEERRKVRIASQEGELLCPDCGERMILCAGAIVQPYFRHYKIQECKTGAELRTKAGKRKYFCRKALFQIVKTAGLPNVRLREEKERQLEPVLFDCDAGTIGYVYLDGKTRNISELWKENQAYLSQKIRLYFFLNEEYKSNAKNITGDEAECARLNGGEIYYLNIKNNTATIRKKYRTGTGEASYYEETYEFDDVIPDEEGRITGPFLERFQKLAKEEKRNFKKVKRFPAEEGISEEYQDMDFLLMDALEEVWILPRFRYRMENDEEADARRYSFLEEQNLRMFAMEVSERTGYAWEVAEYISTHLNSWDWI